MKLQFQRQLGDLALQCVQVGVGSIFRGVKCHPVDEWVPMFVLRINTKMLKKTSTPKARSRCPC